MHALSDKRPPIGALIADLPSPGLVRWTPHRKLGVLKALDHGLLMLDEACRRYDLTPEEIEEWRGGFRRYGTAGLKTTTLQERRRGTSATASPP
jgi:hypothetical protein